jgi:hypothetical protein
MGSYNSQLYLDHPKLMQFKQKFNKLGLQESKVEEMFILFHEMDKDFSGTISNNELMKFLKLERSNFSEKAFLLFDYDKSGELDFEEFVLAIYNYCTLSYQTLQQFVFELYDTNRNGELGSDEVIVIIKDIYGNKKIQIILYIIYILIICDNN